MAAQELCGRHAGDRYRSDAQRGLQLLPGQATRLSTRRIPIRQTTGTLWEHDKPQASCNHGFASHAAVVLRRDILGLREIDHCAKTVSFAVPDHPLQECRGSFPTADGKIVVEWKRDGSKPKLTLPAGCRQGAPSQKKAAARPWESPR